MEAMIQIVGMPMEQFWAEMDKRYGNKEIAVAPAENKTELSAAQARAELSDKGKPIDYKTFRKHLRENGIQPVRKVGRTKYYLKSDLFKTKKIN